MALPAPPPNGEQIVSIPNLQILGIERLRPKHLTLLSSLKSLRTLHYDNEMDDLPVFAGVCLPSVESLCMYGNETSIIGACPNLRHLHLHGLCDVDEDVWAANDGTLKVLGKLTGLGFDDFSCGMDLMAKRIVFDLCPKLKDLRLGYSLRATASDKEKLTKGAIDDAFSKYDTLCSTAGVIDSGLVHFRVPFAFFAEGFFFPTTTFVLHCAEP